MAGDLFTSTAFAELEKSGITVETKERIVYDKYVTLDGVRFDADDLYSTLCAVRSRGVYTSFSENRYAVLKKYGILSSQGSNRSCISAALGDNGKTFIEMLRAAKVEGND